MVIFGATSPGASATSAPRAGVNRADLGPWGAGTAAAALPPAAAVTLTRLSFGAAHDYPGFPIVADDSPPTASLDLAHRGTRPGPANAAAAALPALAAFEAGQQSRCSIRAWFKGADDRRGLWLRARCGDAVRVPSTFVPAPTVSGEDGADNGELAVDLPVHGPTRRDPGIVAENWTWEYRPVDALADAFLPLAVVPVRLYLTAAMPVNLWPRESFYHVACDLPRRLAPERLEREIFRSVARFHDGRSPLANVRGLPLTFWGEFKPGAGPDDYARRDAQALVTLGDATCFGWADLLSEALAIHGIWSTVAGVQPDHARIAAVLRLPNFIPPGAARPIIGILVKPFRWMNADAPRAIACPPTRSCHVDAGDFVFTCNHPGFRQTIPWPTAAVAALGTPCPTDGPARLPGFFANHAIVFVRDPAGARLYDPSFGLGPFPDVQTYEDALLGRGEADSGGLFAVIGAHLQPRTDPRGHLTHAVAATLLGAARPPANHQVLSLYEADRD